MLELQFYNWRVPKTCRFPTLLMPFYARSKRHIWRVAPPSLTFSVPRNKLHCQFHVRCFKGSGRDAEGPAGREHLVFDEQSLEAELKNAIDTENYTQAARLRDELRLLQEDNRARILAANVKFYKVFEKGDLNTMRMLWSKGDNVHCIHPGAGCISGYDLIMESWELTFGPELDLPLQIDLQNVEVFIKGNLGFITCLELVRTSGNNWGKQVATNIFEKVDGNWYICLHHASHIAP
uniref:UVR domain-containing protein n=1 Tax=Araucaria cunninghamii TaxID=56994 RepID=A0A0D6R9M5_ARACU